MISNLLKSLVEKTHSHFPLCTAFPPSVPWAHTWTLCLHTHTHYSFSKAFENNLQTRDFVSPMYLSVYFPETKHLLTYGPKSGNKHYHRIYTLFIVPTILFFLFVFILKHLQSSPTWNSLPVFSFYVLDNLNTGFTFYNITFQGGSSDISALAYSGYAFLVRIQHKCVGSSQSISPGSTLRWPVLPLVKWTLITYVGVCQVYHKNHHFHLGSWLVFCGEIFGDNANTCSSLNFYPQTLAYVGTYLLNQPPVWWLPNSVSSIAIIPPTFISWLIKKAFPPLCIYSLIYNCTNYWIHIFKSLILWCYFYLFWSNCLKFGHWNLSKVVLLTCFHNS